MRIICFGNSTSTGFPGSELSSYIYQLGERLEDEVISRALNGQTIKEMHVDYDSALGELAPDMVVLVGGTNDFIYNKLTPKQAADHFAQMIDLALEKGIIPIIMTPLLTYPDMAANLWTPDENIDYRMVNMDLQDFAGLLMRMSQEKEVPLVDAQLEYRKFNGGYYDGVHPTPVGHVFLADIIEAKIKEITAVDEEDENGKE